MRYTTIIDISTIRAIYRNSNCRLVYLHLALRAGYHDDDRDIADISIRRLAMETGLSISSTRHALKQLLKSGLLQRQGLVWIVTKWVPGEEITPRPRGKQTKADKQAAAAAADRQAQSAKLEAQRSTWQETQAAAAKRGSTPYLDYCNDLKARAESGDTDAAEAYKRHAKAHQDLLAKLIGK